MAGLYTLQNHEIAFRNFKIQDCIYIKDLKQYGNSNSHWRYKIDGIDYYVPNYGYLVLIDTNYKEIEQSDATLIGSDKTKKKNRHRIESTIFGQYTNKKKFPNMSSILKYNCFEAFMNIINPNVYSGQFGTEGGIRPPDAVMQLLGKISKDSLGTRDYDIGNYIVNYMRHIEIFSNLVIVILQFTSS